MKGRDIKINVPVIARRDWARLAYPGKAERKSPKFGGGKTMWAILAIAMILGTDLRVADGEELGSVDYGENYLTVTTPDVPEANIDTENNEIVFENKPTEETEQSDELPETP